MAESFATIHGSPGTRVRFAGLVRLFWPFALALFVAGYLVRCGFPLPEIPPVAAGVALLALAGLAWWTHGKAMTRFGAFLKGARGEELVARELGLLPGAFHVFHGVPNPVGSGDFDHVVVAPGGVALVETKHWRGPVTYVDGELRTQGARPSRSPIAQARKESQQLLRNLTGVAPDVLPVVCFAGDSFVEDWLDTDGLVICNARSLCAVLLARIGGNGAAVDVDAVCRRILGSAQ